MASVRRPGIDRKSHSDQPWDASRWRLEAAGSPVPDHCRCDRWRKNATADARPGSTEYAPRRFNLSFTKAWHGREMPQAMVGIRARAPKQGSGCELAACCLSCSWGAPLLLALATVALLNRLAGILGQGVKHRADMLGLADHNLRDQIHEREQLLSGRAVVT